MNIKINFKKQAINKSSGNLILFTDEKLNISSSKKYISDKEYSYLSDLLKTKDSKQKIMTFDINSNRKIIIATLNKNLNKSDTEKLGAKCYEVFSELKNTEYSIYSDTLTKNSKNLLGYFLHGIKLKS